MNARRQPPSFDVAEGFRTHVGMVRAVNEDAVLQPDGRRRKGKGPVDRLWAVADGMGEVHGPHQLNLKRDVALKLISRDFLLDMEDNPEEVATLQARFQREVQVMAQVRHPNVLQIFDYGSVKPPDDGAAPVEYIAMALIPGDTSPILYIGGRFQLRTAERAPDPVVRVTWKGAAGYAAYYGLQLPTYAQWQTLRREPGFAPQGEVPAAKSTPESVHEQMMGASGAMNNTIRSDTLPADGVTAPVHKEWVTTSSETTREGVADWQEATPPPSPVHRYAWEAFDDVGFRTVRDVG